MTSERAPDSPAMRAPSARPEEGYWTSCDVCARVYWQPYGKTSREAHGPYTDCGPITYDEGRIEGARDEADLLNDLESIACPADDDSQETERE